MAFIKETAKTPNRYLVIGGDLIENCCRSSVGDIFEQTIPPHEQKHMMAKILEPVKDRVLCATEGNHEARSTKDSGTKPIWDICCQLGITERYRPNICFVDISLGKPTTQNGSRRTSSDRPNYMIVVTHGSGGGFLSGSALNKNERFGLCIDGMDALITGHIHKALFSQPGKYVIDRRNKVVREESFKVCTATSWLHNGHYGVRKMMLPTSFCLQELWLSGKGKQMKIREI